MPFRLTHVTDVAEGQATCPMQPEERRNMDDDRYRWQDEFIAKYHALDQQDFTLVACPGSGKTRGTRSS